MEILENDLSCFMLLEELIEKTYKTIKARRKQNDVIQKDFVDIGGWVRNEATSKSLDFEQARPT